MQVRDATAADFRQVLALNEEWVHFLSPLTQQHLECLHEAAACHRIVERDGQVAAFLLAFREGCGYDSPNYRWFADRCDRFIYIDRVVVSGAHRGQGIGSRLYADLFAFAARSGSVRVTCEFDIDPPNEASRRFHERLGFREVGTQTAGSGKKQVSLRSVPVPVVERAESPRGASTACGAPP